EHLAQQLQVAAPGVNLVEPPADLGPALDRCGPERGAAWIVARHRQLVLPGCRFGGQRLWQLLEQPLVDLAQQRSSDRHALREVERERLTGERRQLLEHPRLDGLRQQRGSPRAIRRTSSGEATIGVARGLDRQGAATRAAQVVDLELSATTRQTVE